MNSKLATLMHKAASQSIEAMAFSEVYESESCLSPESLDVLAVHLPVQAPFPGIIGMLASRPFLGVIAENLFAQSADELEERQIHDLVTELLNTIAGSFLNSGLPNDKLFGLGLPVAGCDSWQADDPTLATWGFQVEEQPFTMYAVGEIIEKLAVYHGE